MGEISKHIIINAPAGVVFKYVSDPRNAPRYISSITAVTSGPEGAPVEGQVWGAEANFLGSRNRIRLRLSEMRANQLVRFTIEGEPKATLALRLRPGDTANQTHVSLLLEAAGVPGIILNGLMSGLLGEDMLRLKRILET